MIANRRKFLKNATSLVAGGFIANSALSNNISIVRHDAGDKELICRTLGRTGIKLPVVSMGVMNSNNPNLLKAGWNLGIRHFDTAWIYQGGNNEKMVGTILKELNVDRKDVVITTKIVIDRNLWSANAAESRKKVLIERLNQSLQRLQMDYVDILMIHDVSDVEQVSDTAIKEAMQELKLQGKIKHPAFSTHVYWPEIVTRAADEGFYDVILLSINYSMANDNTSLDAMRYASSKGVGLIAMKTQCQQAWYKQNLPAEAQQFYEGAIMHSALLKWVLNFNEITTAVPGFTTFDQLNTDIQVGYDITFTEEERKFLEDHNVKLAMQSVCRFCGKCKTTCPFGVDIPSLMRTHNYAMAYGNMHMTMSTIRGLEKGSGLDVCSNCDECVAQCVNRVEIAHRVGELKTIMV